MSASRWPAPGSSPRLAGAAPPPSACGTAAVFRPWVPVRRRPWWRRGRIWAALSVLLALAALAGFCLLGSSHPPRTTRAAGRAAPPAAPVGPTWILDFPELAGAGQAASLSGRCLAGDVLFIPAGERFTLTPEQGVRAGRFRPLAASYTAYYTRPAETGWQLDATGGRAPDKPGLYALDWDGDTGPVRFPAVVLVRAESRSSGDRTTVTVAGRSVGHYLDPRRSGVERVQRLASRYRPPEFFAVLTRETVPLPVAEGLALGQLVAFKDFRGPDGRKVYTTERHTDVLPPNRPLIEKLARLRERLRGQGVRVSSFWITSGFRTPEYNRAIGGAAYSRHCFGDAVDLVIDEDGDRHMDDLNGDGRLDRADGLIVGEACRKLEAEGLVAPGGIGVYEWDGDDSVRSHVHLDCRGYPARWGQVSRSGRRVNWDWWSAAGETGVEAPSD